MTLPRLLDDSLALPAIGAPMFIVSGPELVLAQCKAGIVGAFPALNARPAPVLDEWLTRIKRELAEFRAANPERTVAPYAVNQIAHASNDRLMHDVDVCARHEVPIIITSLRAPREVVDRVHAYGGIVLHDVTTIRHAKKALDEGVDGLILVCAGAGGHAGMLSPLALVHEVRRFYSGTVVLSGAITHGASILAAQALGADLAYIGTRFIASAESAAQPGYKQMLVDSTAADVVYTSYFSGVHGNYLKPSVRNAGLDPDNLPAGDKTKMSFASDRERPKVWKDIWSAGQGIGLIDDVLPVAEIVARLKREYDEARQRLCR
jgi:nitronate monooxygenase